jgi:hypothetical protein
LSEATGAGDSACPGDERLQLRLAAGGPLHFVVGLDEGLEEHLALPPVGRLVFEDEPQRADRGRVGDPAGGGQVVAVGGDLAGHEHPVHADELLDGQLRRLRLGHGGHEGLHLGVGWLDEALGAHLPELGETLDPQLGVPGVVVAVPAQGRLHVELGDGGHPPAERLEEPHLDPGVVADPPGRLLHGEQAGELAAVPGSERGAGSRGVAHRYFFPIVFST